MQWKRSQSAHPWILSYLWPSSVFPPYSLACSLARFGCGRRFWIELITKLWRHGQVLLIKHDHLASIGDLGRAPPTLCRTVRPGHDSPFQTTVHVAILDYGIWTRQVGTKSFINLIVMASLGDLDAYGRTAVLLSLALSVAMRPFWQCVGFPFVAVFWGLGNYILVMHLGWVQAAYSKNLKGLASIKEMINFENCQVVLYLDQKIFL